MASLEFRKTEFRLILEMATLKPTYISVYFTPLKFNNRRHARTEKKSSCKTNGPEFTNIFKKGALKFRLLCVKISLCLFLKGAPRIAQVENERGCKSQIWPI